mgnify:CR=1 FL=1
MIRFLKIILLITGLETMDEKLDKQKDEYITPENALRYFYYDFQK